MGSESRGRHAGPPSAWTPGPCGHAQTRASAAAWGTSPCPVS